MPLISPRPSAKLLLPLALLATGLLAGCDRQTPADTQPQSSTSASASGASASGASASGASASGASASGAPDNADEGDGRFSGKLDIASRGSALPDFTFTDPSGKKLRTQDLKGKPLLINLWATWCGPCVLEMPTLDALAAAKAGKLQVLTISQDSDQPEAVAAFFKDRKLTHLAPWLDPDNAMSQHYNTGVLPTTVLYDAEGREVWRWIGSNDWSSPRTDVMLADTLH